MIPDYKGIYPSIDRRTRPRQKGPHVMPDMAKYDVTTRYIHKYNTHSAYITSFETEMLQQQQVTDKLKVIEHQISQI